MNLILQYSGNAMYLTKDLKGGYTSINFLVLDEHLQTAC